MQAILLTVIDFVSCEDSKLLSAETKLIMAVLLRPLIRAKIIVDNS